MYGKGKNSCVLFYFILFYSILSLVSCADSYKEPVREYHEYWTTTCQVGRRDISSEHVSLEGLQNLSARGAIEINLYTINPKGIKLLCKPGAGGTNGTNELGNFRLQNDDGNLLVDNYSETLVDPSHIRIRANLRDEFEGDRITLSGCLWPENRSSFSEEDLKEQNPELFYYETFRQNTPPDNVKNMYVSDSFFSDSVHKVYLSFEVPDQSLNRNLGLFEIAYYLRESDGKLYFKGSETLTLDQRKNTSGENIFQYYFDGQEDNLTAYEYTVQVLGPHGLKSEKLSTDPSLGVCVLLEPSISIVQTPNGICDEASASERYECYEVASNSGTVTFTASPGQNGDTLKVYVDGNLVAPSAGLYTVSGIDRHVIKVVSSRIGARSVTVTKRIRIAKTPDAAVFTFGKEFNGCGLDSSGYEYIEVDSATDTVSYTATAPEEGCSISSVTDKGASVSATGSLNVASHSLVATVTNPYCNPVVCEAKKVCVVTSLSEPTYSCSPSFTGNTIGEFECVEVSSSTAKAALTITAAPGCELDGTITCSDNETSFYTQSSNSYTYSNLGLGEYTITVNVKKNNYITRTFYKYVKVMEALKKPTIEYKTGSVNGDSANSDTCADSSYSSYKTYNVYLSSGASGGTLYFKATPGSGESVRVKDGSTEISTTGSGSVSLGPHNLTFIVSKTGYKDREFVEYVYAQGTLYKPTFNTSNGSTTSTSGIGTSGDPWRYQFSYKNYDNMNCSISAGNSGSSVSLKVNDTSVSYSSFTLAGQGSGSDYYTLEITQTKTYCKKLVTTYYVNVRIKPITLKYNNKSGQGTLNLMLADFGNDPPTFPLKAVIKINGQTAYERTGGYTASQGTWMTLNDPAARSVEITCYSPSDVVNVYTDIARTDKTDCTMRTHDSYRSLSDIKGGIGENGNNAGMNWTYIVDMYAGHYNRKARPRVTFAVSE